MSVNKVKHLITATLTQRITGAIIEDDNFNEFMSTHIDVDGSDDIAKAAASIANILSYNMVKEFDSDVLADAFDLIINVSDDVCEMVDITMNIVIPLLEQSINDGDEIDALDGIAGIVDIIDEYKTIRAELKEIMINAKNCITKFSTSVKENVGNKILVTPTGDVEIAKGTEQEYVNSLLEGIKIDD